MGVRVGLEPTGSLTKGWPTKIVGSEDGITVPSRGSRRRPTRT